jgi:hypothetical protein
MILKWMERLDIFQFHFIFSRVEVKQELGRVVTSMII